MIGKAPRAPVVRVRTLAATSAGRDNLVTVDRPSVLCPFADASVTSQGLSGFALEFRSWDGIAAGAPFIPAQRGVCWLYAAGSWNVRAYVTDTPEGLIPVRETEAASWEEVRMLTAPRATSQRMIGAQVLGIPTTGQTALVSCAESIEAARVEIRMDPLLNAAPATTGAWIGTGGQRGLPNTGLWLAKGETLVLEGARLPIGTIRARGHGGNVVLSVYVFRRSFGP